MGLDVTVLIWVDDVVGVFVDWVLETVEFAVCSIEITFSKFGPRSSVSEAGTIVACARFGVLSAEIKVTESRMNIAMFCEGFNPAHVMRLLFVPPEVLILHSVAAIQINFHTLRYSFCEFVVSQPPCRLWYVV